MVGDLLIGRILYHQRMSPIDCVIRNFSDSGAKIEFDNLALLPDEFDLYIEKKGTAFRAKMAWCGANRAGLAFHPASRDGVISLDHERRLRHRESERRRLHNRLAQLMSEY
jgi:hypothetical protein